MTKTTLDAMETASKVLESSNAVGLLQFLVQALASVMDAEVAARCGAGYDERSAGRVTVRNGYRDRVLEKRWRSMHPLGRTPATALPFITVADQAAKENPEEARDERELR